MKSKYILGVDGGGTRTTVNIADFEGKVLADVLVLIIKRFNGISFKKLTKKPVLGQQS